VSANLDLVRSVSESTRGGANLFRIRDGLVVRLDAYFDRDRALADLGLEG
jgi:hypothetical protein